MKRLFTLLIVVGCAMFVASCSNSVADDQTFEKIAADFIEKYLEMNPEAATALGDHRWDHRMDDYSLAGVKANLAFNKATLDVLEEIDPARLGEINRVDYHILRNQVEETIFRLETLREYEWNPLVYNVGGAIYNLLVRDFAPLKDRLRSVEQRLRQLPGVTALAKANLKNPPRVHVETAIRQNKGTIGLIQDGLQAFVDEVPELSDELRPVRQKAVAALEYYGNWLERDLLPTADGEFRLGEDKFRRKLHYVLESDLTMEDILGQAEKALSATQEEMYRTALPLYRQAAGSGDSPDRKLVIKTVLDRLAETHPSNETIVGKASECLDECTRFVSERNLVTVPDEPINLIVMPEFQRGVAVAYCDAPGPLEPQGKTFYAISPTPEDWDEARVTSFFREYNDYMLHDLTIHEAVPGHYLQLAHSNRFKAPTMIRSIFYSGPFVEGWATYAEQLMAEKGYGGPEVKMQQLKMRLRLIINAIIDQKIHTAGMTEQEAIDLMIGEGFQEEGEAAGKWRRACLTSTQLSTYFVGNIEVNAIRDAYEEKQGENTDMKTMHDRMLSFGSPPAKYVKELMGL
ncbi:MAG: DUF885 domain-containing protein [Candidatus Krumholzibacteriia bacterium]